MLHQCECWLAPSGRSPYGISIVLVRGRRCLLLDDNEARTRSTSTRAVPSHRGSCCLHSSAAGGSDLPAGQLRAALAGAGGFRRVHHRGVRCRLHRRPASSAARRGAEATTRSALRKGVTMAHNNAPLELLQIEEADAWSEYLEMTRGQSPQRYDEVEPWAWAQLKARRRGIRRRRRRLRAAVA